ncbi:MAG: RAMP superfamily CRISPR-associated protein, partial [Pseudomonadota bacterium]
MLINRIDFKADIVSQTEISVGQGTEHVDVETLDGADGQHVQKQQRLLATGVNGQYIIPVSSLKGALRSRHSQDDTFCKRVFGHVEHTDGSVGAQGRLELDDAVAITAVQQVSRKGTAINRQRGAADINKLFDRTFLPAGSKFTFTGRMFY